MDFSWIGSPSFQNIVLIATLVAAISIGYKQNQINESIRLAALQPILLCNGTIVNWEDLRTGSNKDAPLIFNVHKNIALDIQGFVVLDSKKYKLLLSFATLEPDTNKITCSPSYREKIGWVQKDGFLCAIFNPAESEDVGKPNGISLTYRDSEGGLYFTEEDSSFVQKSGKASTH